MKRRGTAIERVSIENDMLSCRFSSEAELRSSIARIADAYGWLVEEEVVVPGWGRIDLVLRSSPQRRPLLVELKVALLKPSDVRRAYQQVDGYSRWWAKEKSAVNTPILASNKADMSLIKSIGDAYPTVAYRSAHALIKGMRTWELCGNRVARAWARQAERRHEADINDAAVGYLAQDVEAEKQAFEARSAALAATLAAARAGERAE